MIEAKTWKYFDIPRGERRVNVACNTQLITTDNEENQFYVLWIAGGQGERGKTLAVQKHKLSVNACHACLSIYLFRYSTMWVADLKRGKVFFFSLSEHPFSPLPTSSFYSPPNISPSFQVPS